jgi:glyoxylase-like metal-dependent hydrolase (beta-lactamase superfamily II)
MLKYQMIKGNTGCLTLRGCCIPFYKLSEKEWILMDSGMKADRQELLAYFSENQIVIKAILTSHAHFDHVGNHMALREKYGSQIIMTAFDAGMTYCPSSVKACFYHETYSEVLANYDEMIVKTDRIIELDQEEIMVCGVNFRILWLPGHAASQVGFATPDEVLYLADVLVNRETIEREKMLYTLEWKMAIDSIRQLKTLPKYSYYVLAHCGVYEEIEDLIDANLEAAETMVNLTYQLIPESASMDVIIRQVIAGMGIKVRNIARAKYMERLIRSILENMTETGKVETAVEDGIVIYRKKYINDR